MIDIAVNQRRFGTANLGSGNKTKNENLKMSAKNLDRLKLEDTKIRLVRLEPYYPIYALLSVKWLLTGD